MFHSHHQGKAGDGEALVHGVHLFCQQQPASQVTLVSRFSCALIYAAALSSVVLDILTRFLLSLKDCFSVMSENFILALRK